VEQMLAFIGAFDFSALRYLFGALICSVYCASASNRCVRRSRSWSQAAGSDCRRV
jgi:hypothetical protein